MNETDPSIARGDGPVEQPGIAEGDLGNLPTGAALDAALLRRSIKERLFGAAPPVTGGGYEVSHRLGAGGMGVVYLARDPDLDRKVALKLLWPGHRLGQARLLREGRALAKLAHPNVVTIHEVGTDDDQVFVAMEFVEGETVGRWLGTRRSLPELARVFAQAARGLTAAHEQQLVHRDFKPDNAIIGNDGRVRVVDFGLALAEGSRGDASVLPAGARIDRLSQTGELVGTPGYMAPEQLHGGEIDARTDVFAFCVALYEALHGQRPYSCDSIDALLTAMQAGPGRLAWRRDLPTRWVTLLREGLATDMARRPSDLRGLTAELERIAAPTRPRRHSVVFAASLGLLGLGSGVAFALSRTPAPIEPDTTTGAIVDTPAVDGPVAIDDGAWVCPGPDPDDHRSCDELAEQLMTTDDAVGDRATRCAFRRLCSPPSATTCPPGTEYGGTTGCTASASCPIEGLDPAASACIDGNATCCVLAANLRFEQETPADEGQRNATIVDELARACAAGDAEGCASLGTMAMRTGDESSGLAARVNACLLGHAQACRRIAILPEDRRGLDESCVELDDERCRRLDRSPALRARMAECKSTLWEVPAVLTDDAAVLSDALVRAGVSLAPGEATAVDRGASSFRSAMQAEYLALAIELGLDLPHEPSSLAELHDGLEARVLQTAGLLDMRLAIQRIADEQAEIPASGPVLRRPVIER
ncbi:MAG: serine/threonine protein kinase, partial [Myxococcales bacterium]|nr:serine/threonine protein kinase [Myxococcales bacterium]